MKNRGDLMFGIIVSVCAILLLGSLFIFKDKFKQNDKTTSSTSYTDSTVYKLDVKNKPVLGDKNAPVTVVEFGDYKCPACGYFTNNLIPQINQDYIQKGKVKLVFENFPFIYNDSTRTAIFQKGVYDILGNEAFWKMHEKIYNYQTEYYKPNDGSNEHKDVLTENYLLDTAAGLFGKDKANQLKDVLSNKQYQDEVSNDLNHIKNLNISSTPTVFVNNKMINDPLKLQTLEGAIDEALKNSEHK